MIDLATLTTVLQYVAGGMIALAALVVLVRIVRGPSLVDRVIGADVMLTTLIIVVAAEMAINGHTHTVALMVVLTAVGVFGSISVARFISRPDPRVEAESDVIDGEHTVTDHADDADGHGHGERAAQENMQLPPSAHEEGER